MTSQPGHSEPVATPRPPDEVPPEVVASALAAFGAADLGSVLAELVSDSLDDDAGGAAPPRVRRLRFAAPGLSLALTLQPDASGGTELHVVVDPPPVGGLLEVHGPAGPVASSATALGPGRWSLAPAPTGPVSLTVRPSSTPVRTAWARL